MKKFKGGYVYILTSKNRKVLYTGVTASLLRRVSEHKNHFNPNSFTAKYEIGILLYYEWFDTIDEAIAREKFIKGKVRNYKLELINQFNPNWDDLFDQCKVLRLH
ncbi:MAG: GIY-YIG nuclease family protein [Bacteroidetes bacterium]|nr:GIY-YIG nuclease family protein [Bacteroidota bacterium]